MSDNSKSNSGALNVGGLLGVSFILLKLLNIAPFGSWSWWWILAPFWLPVTIGLFAVIVVFIFKEVFFQK